MMTTQPTGTDVHGLDARAVSRGPRVEHHVEEDTWAPVLLLDPIADALVEDISRALWDDGAMGLLRLLGRSVKGSDVHDFALRRIREILRAREVWQVPLHPDAADVLYRDLDAALEQGEPAMCVRRGEAYAIAGSEGCAPCDEILTGQSPALSRVVGGAR